MKPVCLVTGVGPEHGTGAEIARRFSTDYRVAMLARNAENIEALAAKYPGTKAYPCDVGDLYALKDTIARVCTEMGAPCRRRPQRAARHPRPDAGDGS
jgi:NADP-dependent 3-hydroxy acid dehydrogenase YdfG